MKVERLQQIRRRVRRAYQEISSAGGFQIRNYLETQNCKLTFLIDLPGAYQRTSTRTYFQHQVRGFQWVQNCNLHFASSCLRTWAVCDAIDGGTGHRKKSTRLNELARSGAASPG